MLHLPGPPKVLSSIPVCQDSLSPLGPLGSCGPNGRAACMAAWANAEPSLVLKVTQLCQILCNPMDCSLPGSFIHGIFQARILEWVAISFSRGSSRPRDRTRVSCTADSLLSEPPVKSSLVLSHTQNQRLFRSLSKWAGETQHMRNM